MTNPIVDSDSHIRAVIWQDSDEYPGEQAVVVKYYTGDQLIAVAQNGKEILLNLTTIPVLISELRKLYKEVTG